MEQNKINFIVAETTDLHDRVAELYEALMDKENVESIKIIDKVRDKLLVIRKDIANEV